MASIHVKTRGKPSGASTEMVAALCDDCGKFCYGPRALLSEALDEHRRIGCTAKNKGTEDGRKYELWYPSKT